MNEKRALHELSDLDRNIVNELVLDATLSGHELAKKLKVSANTVNRRIRQLVDNGVLTYRAYLDLAALGYPVIVALAINTHRGQADFAARQLESLPQIRATTITTGSYDIIAWAIFKNLHDLLLFVNQQVGSISEISSVESMVYLSLVRPFRGHSARVSDGSVDLCAIDAAIIQELQFNPRETMAVLSKKLGISRPTVQKKLKSLRDHGIIETIATADPRALGLRSEVVILVRTTPSESINVANSMLIDDQIAHIGICSGLYDIVAVGVFSSSEAMSGYLKNNLSNRPGVINCSYVLQVEMTRFNPVFGITGPYYDGGGDPIRESAKMADI